jgi:hypothetical protein
MDASREDAAHRIAEAFGDGSSSCIGLHRAAEESDMMYRGLEQRDSAGDLEELHSGFPHDAEQFALGLEDDRKLHKIWLVAGFVSEAALAGMFVTALEEPGRVWSVVLAILVVGLSVAMVVHLARFRLNGKRTHRANDTG